MHLARSFVLPLIALSLPLLGCEKRACFQWTEVEGACPSSDDALEFFQNPDCLNAIRSVDSEADFDGELCCYDVTSYDTGDETCGTSVGSGSTGGIPTPAKPPFDGGSSSGGGSIGTAPACASCLELIVSPMSPSGCGESEKLAEELLGCECAGACGSVCCGAEAFPTDACAQCRAQSPMDCGAEFDACASDGQRPSP